MIGSDKCRLHGGATPRGIASPHFRHGRYSKHLPARLAELYEQARADPDLLSVLDDIALANARLSDILMQIEPAESQSAWAQVKEAYDAFETARQMPDSVHAAAALSKAVESWKAALDAGLQRAGAWDELARWMNLKRKLVEAEANRMQELQMFVPVDEVMLLAAALVAAVRNHVSDRDVLRKIQGEFARLVPNARAVK